MNPIEAMIFNLKTAITAMNEIEVKGFNSVSHWMDAVKIINNTIISLEGALKKVNKEDVTHADCNEQREDV